MSTIFKPTKDDRENGTCTRFRVNIYNPRTQKRITETVIGTLAEAKAREAEMLKQLGLGTLLQKGERPTLSKMCEAFLQDQIFRANTRGTINGYRSIFDCHLIPKFGEQRVESITREAVRAFAEELTEKKVTPKRIKQVIRYFRMLLTFCINERVIEHNPLAGLRQSKKKKGPAVQAQSRAYNEVETRTILSAATLRERALVGVLVCTGIRPGEVYALPWCELKYAERCARIARNWDYVANEFTSPKTAAGERFVSLDEWLIEQLEAYRKSIGAALDSEDLIFSSTTGTPLNPSNLRRDMWIPLIKRAGVRYLPMNSLRRTFASVARTMGQVAFNVSRHMGHAQSTIVDTVYAQTLDSGLMGMSEGVAQRVLSWNPNTGKTGAVTQPLHEIFKSGLGTRLITCFDTLVTLEVANDQEIKRAMEVNSAPSEQTVHP